MEDLKKLCSPATFERFGVTALKILQARYLLKDALGKTIETVEEWIARVATAASRGDPDLFNQFYSVLINKEFFPNSPALMNSMLPDGQLCACFVTDIDDSMESIFSTLHDWAKLFKSGAGVGTNFSKLRPENDPVRSTSGASSGPVSFMGVFDKMIDVVKSGGRRFAPNGAV